MKKNISKVTKRLCFVLIILFLTLLFFWKIAIHSDQMIYPAKDIINYFSFLRGYFANSLKQYGEFPLWNPYVFSGYPFIGNPQSGIFYPINILFIIFPTNLVFGYVFVLDIFLIGLFAYLFCRAIHLDKYSSLVSAIIFMFSGTLIGRIYAGHLPNVDAVVWFPLTLLFYELAIEKKNLIYGVLAGISLALQFLTGHIQFAAYGLVGSVLYFILRSISQIREEQSTRGMGKPLLILAISFILCFSLSAVQLLPSIEFSGFSNRTGGVSYEFASQYSLPPYHLITFIAPEFFGNPIDGSYVGRSNFWELCGYMGVLPLILCLIGVLFKKNRYTIIFSIFVLFTLLFSFGKYSPFFSIFYYYIPGFNMFRVPATFLYIYSFSIAILCGFGSSFLIGEISEKNKNKLKLLIIISAIISILIAITTFFVYYNKEYFISLGKAIASERYSRLSSLLSHPLSYYHELVDSVLLNMIKSIIILILFFISSIGVIFIRIKKKIKLKNLKLLIILLILLDLWFFGMKYIDTKNPEEIFKAPELINVIKNDAMRYDGKYRILSLSGASFNQYLTLIHDIEIATGYDPSYLRDYQEFLWLIGNHSALRYGTSINIYDISNPNPIRLLNIRYIVTNQKLSDREYKEIYAQNNTFVYRVNNTLPRAFIIPNASVITSRDEMLNILKTRDFNPRKTVLLEKIPNVPLINNGIFKKADITEYTPNKISMDINTSASGFLVLSEIWYPGWRAYVDGKETEIYKANYILRSIYLKDGKHKVLFVYDPISYKIGKLVSLVSLLMCISAILFKRGEISI